jgi:hypothetical protein
VTWRDGMLLEDYLDAVAFRQKSTPPPLEDWCEELRQRLGVESFRGIG